MAPPLRIEFPGAICHIMARGNSRLSIVEDNLDKQEFLTILAKLGERFHCLRHAYCLMGNHYHLVIGAIEANLLRAIHHLKGFYTQ